MIAYTALAAYEKAIQARFPSVTVIPDTRLADEYDDSLCVLGVPEESKDAFYQFVFEELAPAMDARGIDLVAVLGYTQAEAERFFPEACRETAMA